MNYFRTCQRTTFLPTERTIYDSGGHENCLQKTNNSYFIFLTSKTGNVCHCVKWFWIVLTSRMCSTSKYFVADIVGTTILKIEKQKNLSWLQVNMHFFKNWKIIETSSHEICQTRNCRLQFWYSIFSETVNLGCNGC